MTEADKSRQIVELLDEYEQGMKDLHCVDLVLSKARQACENIGVHIHANLLDPITKEHPNAIAEIAGLFSEHKHVSQLTEKAKMSLQELGYAHLK